MAPRAAIVGALIVWASCNKSEGGDIESMIGGLGTTRAMASGSNFSAELAKDLGLAVGKNAVPAAGSNQAVALAVDAKAGSNAAAMVAPKPGSNATVAAVDAKAGSNAGRAVAVPGKTEPPPKLVNGVAMADPGKPAEPSAPIAPVAPEPRTPVKVSAELAAIKISLLPNWDRDVTAPGTFQYVVRIKGTQATKTFLFRYGFEDPKAPTDHDLYKKYLLGAKLMTGELRDRQRGSAWFLEGADASGAPAFRYVILYGGKQLICYGPLYKDAESSRLGDDRDQTVIQAKQICETLAL